MYNSELIPSFAWIVFGPGWWLCVYWRLGGRWDGAFAFSPSKKIDVSLGEGSIIPDRSEQNRGERELECIVALLRGGANVIFIKTFSSSDFFLGFEGGGWGVCLLPVHA